MDDPTDPAQFFIHDRERMEESVSVAGRRLIDRVQRLEALSDGVTLLFLTDMEVKACLGALQRMPDDAVTRTLVREFNEILAGEDV